MIKIDGSQGEGGGQIIRTATSLSAFAMESVEIENIRANRSNPGLRPQHVKGVEALSRLCGAETEGVRVGSETVSFKPNELDIKDLEVDIGTAGSVTLLLQSLMLPLLRTPEDVEVKVKGGTDVKWSPPADYLKHILLPILNGHGYDASLEIRRRGYYPKGGGEVVLRVSPSSLKELELAERGEIRAVRGFSHASTHLRKSAVADRQRQAAVELLEKKFGAGAEVDVEYVDARCPGSGIQLWLITENSRIGGNALGERGKKAEVVGREAVEDLIANSREAVDRYAADQLLPFLAVAGGTVKVSEVTPHCRTNQRVIEKFLEVEFKTEGREISVIG